MPRITVIMPAYQAAATLAHAMASVCRQTCRDWELVVVNDGSTDDTGDVAARMAATDRRIRVIHHERNLGAATAMNRAWRSGAAPLVALLDADDAALPQRLALQAEYLAGQADVAVLGGTAHCLDSAGNFLRTLAPPARHEDLLRRRWHVSPFIHSTVMMRRSFLETTGGYEDGLRLGEDYDLWMRGFQHGGFRYRNLDVPLALYRSRPIQPWIMVRAGARARWRAGQRERQAMRGALAAGRVLLEGAVEQSGLFVWRERRRFAGRPPAAMWESLGEA